MSANDESDLLHKLLEIASEVYKHKISTHTKAALAHKRKLGLRTGRIPYGWKLAADGKHLEENPVEQPAFREIEKAHNETKRIREEREAVEALLQEERVHLAAAVSVEIRKEIRARISALRKKRVALVAAKKHYGKTALVVRLNSNPTLYPKRTRALWVEHDIYMMRARLARTGALWVPQDIQAMCARLDRIEEVETKEVQS